MGYTAKIRAESESVWYQNRALTRKNEQLQSDNTHLAERIGRLEALVRKAFPFFNAHRFAYVDESLSSRVIDRWINAARAELGDTDA